MPQGRNIVGAGTEYYFSSFDDGMGFRYEFPRQQQLQEFLIDDEVTEFVFLQIMMLEYSSERSSFYEALFEKKLLVRWDG